VNFVKTFSSNASAREKIDALRRACKTHTALTKQCASGLGQDRILYAMYCLAQQRRKRAQRARSASMSAGSAVLSSSSDEDDSDGPQAGLAGAEVSARIAARIPQLFKDPGYAQLGHSLAYFGFGPVVSDGLGIGYIIKVGLVFRFLVFGSARASKRAVDDR
jgi:carnitine O-acetyltransferase